MSVPQGAIRIAAPAKLNLYLHVTGRRDDGYHLIDSLIAFAAVHDTLTLAPADRLMLAIEGPFASALDGGDNLVLQAARQLAQDFNVADGAAITLGKRLPVAAGIGGGSADAAAALKGLCTLWGIDASLDDLARIGMALGADVPACLFGAPAFVSGVGELIEPAPRLPPVHAVLVNPLRPLATVSVFRARKDPFSRPATFTESPPDAAALVRLLAERRNDLLSAAAEIEPAVATVMAAIEAAGSCLLARLSGSGATCFGLYGSADDAGEAAARIASGHPDWWVVATRLLAPGEVPNPD